MKILQINASYKPAYIYGGPTLSVSRLCEGLVKEGKNVEVLCTTANGPEELAVKENEAVVVDGVIVTYFKRLTKDHTHFSPALLQGLRKKIGDRRRSTKASTIVHIHAWWNLVSIFSCLIAKLYNVPVVLSPRGTLSSYSFGNRNSGIKDYIHRFLGKSLLEYCHFHVTSEKEKEDILKLVKPKSITVIPNFVFLPKIQNESLAISDADANSSKPLKLLFLSRIEEKKGLDILFKALANFDYPYLLNIAGSGEENYINSLKGLAKKLNIESKIQWVGQQSQEEKWKVMHDHDLLALTSHDENFANVVIECLSTGTGVLLSDRVGLADYVQSADLGWVCRAQPESVKEALVNASSNRYKLIQIREIAPQKIRQDFDEEVLVKRYIKMYEEII